MNESIEHLEEGKFADNLKQKEIIMTQTIEHRFSHFTQSQTAEYSTRLDTDHGTLDLYLARHRIGTETTVFMKGRLGRQRFERRFARQDNEILIRFEDNRVGTSLHWFKDNESPLADVVIRHDGQAAHLAQVDTSRPSRNGHLVDINGNVLDLQGERKAIPIHCDQLIQSLAEDRAFSDFLFGYHKELSGGVRVSGTVRKLDDQTPVPHAKVTLRWCQSFEEAKKGVCLSKNVRYTMANAQGRFEFLHVHGSYIQVLAETIIEPNKPFEGFFEKDGVTKDFDEDVLIHPSPPQIHDMFAVCDIIFGSDIGGLADCYAWVIIYGP